jgi:ABC-type polysaccharide/polyol phosphate export permease
MPFLTAGIILTVIGVVLMKTDTAPLFSPFVLAAGIIISFIGSAILRKKDK